MPAASKFVESLSLKSQGSDKEVKRLPGVRSQLSELQDFGADSITQKFNVMVQVEPMMGKMQSISDCSHLLQMELQQRLNSKN